jgi:peptidoglycan/xylan/chitin deacetylase (PgdA/CDA1 family)
MSEAIIKQIWGYKIMKTHVCRTAITAVLLCLILVQVPGCRAKKEAAIKISLSKTSISLLAGETQALGAKVSPAGKVSETEILWSSDNPKVAAVDSGGVVTAVGAGKCEVTYTFGQKNKAVCSVTVAPSSDKVTVLMFHSVFNQGNKLRIPVADFDAEMKWLSDNGCTALTMDELYSHMEAKTPFPVKSVLITFDDGYEDNYNYAFPILKKYNLHATLFMITGKIGTYGYLSASELREMSGSGLVNVQCHTVTHPNLDELSYDAQYKELNDSKQTLENLLGKKVEYLAYPSGRHNQDSMDIAQSLGYKICFTMDGGTGSLQSSLYEFPRAFVDKNLNTLINAADGNATD